MENELMQKVLAITGILNSIEDPIWTFSALCVCMDHVAAKMDISIGDLIDMIKPLSEIVAATEGPMIPFECISNVSIVERKEVK